MMQTEVCKVLAAGPPVKQRRITLSGAALCKSFPHDPFGLMMYKFSNFKRNEKHVF